MATAERIEVELPASFHHRTAIRVRIDDVNYGGHVGYDRVLSLVHEARYQLLAARGWTELDVGGGVGIAIASVAAVYRAEVLHGMELVVESAVAALRHRGCDLFFRATDAATGREVARVRQGIVFFDYATRRVAAMPEAFRAAFGADSPPGPG